MPSFFSNLRQRLSSSQVDWEELEHLLITGDFGIKTTTEIVDKLRSKSRLIGSDDVEQEVKHYFLEKLPALSHPLSPLADEPLVVLVAGVNGTGKTTSTAKLAHLLKSQGNSVMLAAADTFRAAAIEQLDVWAQRLEIPIFKGEYQSDPASVCYRAYQEANEKKVNFLICDTAGRLHTRHNLMEELKKLRRSLGKLNPEAPHERLLVIDGGTGSNAHAQAKEFHAALDLSGLIVSKLDGSGKGGVILPIYEELGIPPRFIGTGEGLEDFSSFNAQHFVENVL